MAHTKPRWRRMLTGRYLRWWLASQVVRAVPSLARKLAFFPSHVGVIEGADRVLADTRAEIPPEELQPDAEFLRLCAPHDSRAPKALPPQGVVTGRRTALYTKPWVDMATGSVLLPAQARTVLVRGERANWNATSVRFGRPRIPVAGRVFAPIPTTNYFHQLLENGCRLIDLVESGVLGDEPLTVVKQEDRSRVEAAMYRGLRGLYPQISVRIFSARAVVEPEEAVIHFPRDNYWEWAPVDRALADRLGEAFDVVHGEVARRQAPAALYLSRQGARLRTATNEEALAAALDGRGIECFTASDTNHAEQVARFRAARLIVAIHGAGLTNLVFCAPGARVIEIFPGNHVKSPYWWLARRLNLRYRPVICGPGDYHQHFEVDLDAVIRALEEE